MAWRLAPQVTMTAVGADLVFLDVVRDSYLCLPAAAGALRSSSYGLVIDDPEVASELAAAELIVDHARGGHVHRPAPSPRADLLAHTPPKLRLGDRLAFGATVAANSRRYHGRTLAQMVALAAQRGDGPGRYTAAAPDPVLLRQALVFDRLLPWAPRQEACLYRSFMLLRFLGDLGRDANWVFGVRTRPFEAHCWIQVGSTVLNDNLDHVRSYTPILVT